MLKNTTKRKLKEGDVLVCSFAYTQFYEVGREYPLEEHEGNLFIIGSDGVRDDPALTQSQFKLKEEDEKETPTRKPSRTHLHTV